MCVMDWDNRRKIIIFGPPLIIFEASVVFEAAGAVVESGSRLKPSQHLQIYPAQSVKRSVWHISTLTMYSTFFSSNFSLCEVTVAEGGIVKQRTLPDQLQNLAERIGLASRYYIKNKNSSESLLPDETVADLVSQISLHLKQSN